MALISLTCPHCGSNLDMNIGKLMAVCPYCGQKMLYDSKTVSNIVSTAISETEKTKREEIKANTKIEMKKLEHREDARSFWRLVLWFFMIMGLFFLMMLMGIK